MALSVWTIWIFIFAIILQKSVQEVFLSTHNANAVLGRQKRANLIHLEELFYGNLERECLEERCTYEEAREALENKDNTDRFWIGYLGGRQCTRKPCQNHGECKDTIRSYTCTCPSDFDGINCEYRKNDCHPHMTEGCQHFCIPGEKTYTCSCAQGYELGQDRKSCSAKDPFACGKIQVSVAKSKKTSICKYYSSRGEFPWQVLLINSSNQIFCSGAILSNNYVLTSAWCMNQFDSVRVVTGKLQTQDDKEDVQVHDIKKATIHSRYSEEDYENDIALLKLTNSIQFKKYVLPICLAEKDFAEQILIPQGISIVSGWKTDEDEAQDTQLKFQLPFRSPDECETVHNITLTNRMLCTMSHPLVRCQFTNGSPLVTEHEGTWFLTGILSFLSEEHNCSEGFVFTKISRYITWIKQLMHSMQH